MKYLFLAVFLSACSFKTEKISNSDSIVPTVSASQVSYALVNQYVLGRSCVTCHNSADSKGGVNLEQYPNVAALIEKIKSEISSGRMPKPPIPPLSAKQKDLFAVWIAAGAPLNAGGEAPPLPAPVEANFPSILSKVVSVKCTSCHNPAGRAKAIPLSTVPDLLCRYPSLVIPGNAAAGDFIKSINPAAPRMPPRSSPIPKVTAPEFEAIQAWIAGGALEEGEKAVECPPPAPLPPLIPLEPKFAAIKQDIFDQKCTICHSPEGRKPEMPLDTAAALLRGPKPLVIPGDLNSKLLSVFLPGARHPMPPPGNGIDPLSAEELGALQEWIKNGASD